MFSENSFKLICSKHFKNQKLSSLDIRFTTELSKGTIRMWERISHEVSIHYHGKFNKLEKLYITILNSAVYQLDYMSKIPNYAVVSTSVEITKIFFPKYSKLTNGLLRNIIDCRKQIDKPSKNSPVDYLSTYYSHPKWLVSKWKQNNNYESLIKLLKYNNQPPKVWFRYDKNVVDLKTIKDELNDKKIKFEFISCLNNFFTINNPSTLLNNKIFKKGSISVQSPVNGLIVKLLDPMKYEKITDLCAAPGGKAIAISEHMLKTGEIFAYDINKKRASTMMSNCKKHNMKNIKIDIKDASKNKIPYSSKMIADVPCLGTGTISKNVDLKWKKTENDLIRLTNLQEKILSNSSKYLSSNGVIVYSTCSIEDEENWMVVNKFLDSHPNYIVDDAKKYVNSKFTDSKGAINIKPQKHKIDGGFAVRLINYEN